MAVGVLDEVGRTFTDLVKQRFGSQPGNAGTSITATVFDPAHLEPGTVAPHPARNAVLAAVLGLLLGATAAFVRDALDERVRSRDDAAAWLNAPVVGVIPQVASAGRRPGPARRQDIAGNHAMLEAFYMLRANLEFHLVIEQASRHPIKGRRPQRIGHRRAAPRAEVRAEAGRLHVRRNQLLACSPDEVARLDDHSRI